jgi:hypothetical protein
MHRCRRIAIGIVLATVVSFPAHAWGRSQRNLSYRADQAWTSVVRLLRVDLGFEIVERDSDAHYLLFRYNSGETSHPGSLELVERTMENGIVGVTVIVSVPELPTYVELNLIDRLERKLRDEIGPPAQPARPVAANGPRPHEREDQAEDEEDEEREGEEETEDNE